MDFIFNNHETEQLSSLKSVLWTYNQVRYGLKFFLWTKRDKKAIFNRYREFGMLDNFKIAPTRRQKDGSYDSDGSEIDWNQYNLAVWKEFSDDFETKTNPETLNLKTIKDLQKQKESLFLYFLEQYGNTVNIKYNCDPLTINKPVVDSNGVAIKLISKEPKFSIKSPNGAVELILSRSPNSKQMITNIHDNTERPEIILPHLALPIMQKMFEYANIISNNVDDVIKTPHYYLNIDLKNERKFQEVQLFLLEQNQLSLERRKEQQQKNTTESAKSLSHENIKESDKILVTTTNNKANNKAKTLDYTQEESDAPIYSSWHDIKHSAIDNSNYYGVNPIAFIEWLDTPEERSKWAYDERLFIWNPDCEFGLDPVNDCDEPDNAWTLNGLNLNLFKTTLYLEEADFQIYYGLNKHNMINEIQYS